MLFSSKTVNTQCRTVDIFPTILEMSGKNLSNLNNEIHGESLFELIEKSNDDRESFVETGGLYGPWPSPEKHNVFCVVNKNKKLIYNDTPQTWEFYDLENDPNELTNIYDENLTDVINFKKRLLNHFEENQIVTNIKNQ